MKLRFTPRAVENIFKVSAYLHERNPPAARRVWAEIFATAENLLLFPAAGRRQRIPGVRKIVTRKYGYLIYYAVDEGADEVVILNVKHPARERDYQDV